MDGGQVPLMRVLDSGVAAMDAHRGVAGVVKQGLGFLRNLAVAADNKVGGEGFGVGALGGCRVLPSSCGRGTHWAGLGWAVWAACVCEVVQRGGCSGEWDHVVRGWQWWRG